MLVSLKWKSIAVINISEKYQNEDSYSPHCVGSNVTIRPNSAVIAFVDVF
jgi:hypothetical protein